MTTAQLLVSLKGQTIENVTARLNEDGNAKDFILYLVNGEQIEFNAGVRLEGNEEYAAEPEIYVNLFLD